MRERCESNPALDELTADELADALGLAADAVIDDPAGHAWLAEGAGYVCLRCGLTD